MNEADYLGTAPDVLAIFSAIDSAVTAIGEAERRVSRSQTGLFRKHPFAALPTIIFYFGATTGVPLTGSG